MPPPLHIVEPTLADHRGHTRSLVQLLCDAGPEIDVTVWAATKAPAGLIEGSRVETRPWFRRRIRVLQQGLLVRRLLRGEGTVFLSTAGRTDVELVDRTMGRAPAQRLFLYVHWLRSTPSRLRALGRVARRRPDLRLGAATESVRDRLAACGFRSVTWIPYPMAPRHAHPGARAVGDSAGESPAPRFRHVLYAGAARRDKGFHHVVDLVTRWHALGRHLPVVVQVGGDYFGRLSAEVRTDLARLEGVAYAGVQMRSSGLAPTAYHGQFPGAICVQLYDPLDFEDRASGVTLDAFAAGAPVVAWRGGWISRQIQRYGGGVSVTAGDLEGASQAIDAIVRDYARYAHAARRTGAELAAEHDPRRLVDAVLGR